MKGKTFKLCVLIRWDFNFYVRSSPLRGEKIKLMTNNTSGINTEIKVNGRKLKTVTSFKYLGSVCRVAQLTAALTKLKPVWNDRSISLSSKND